MLYLESFLHRVELAEIVSRWIVNRPQPEDVQRLKRIVNFNSYIARIWVDRLAQELISSLHQTKAASRVIKTKGALKDLIVQTPPYSNQRIEELFYRYGRFPEDFYRDTPYDGRCYYTEMGGNTRFLGTTRIKRFRRIAEKGSRRIIDYMMSRIRANADALAEDRARRRGIPKDQLITSPEEQVDEFLHAERRLLKSIRLGSIQSEFPVLSIPDVVGIKLICEHKEWDRLIEILHRHPNCTVIEQERHDGRYQALNMRVSYVIPRDRLLNNVPTSDQIRVFASRGLSPHQVVSDYISFISSSSDHVLLEIIASSYEELLESEIGRCMHEERIIAQRSSRDYTSHVATNILYLMEYILTLCLAPTCEPVTEVPIKLWGRYMPDTIERLLRLLFELPVDASFESYRPPKAGSGTSSSSHSRGDSINSEAIPLAGAAKFSGEPSR